MEGVAMEQGQVEIKITAGCACASAADSRRLDRIEKSLEYLEGLVHAVLLNQKREAELMTKELDDLDSTLQSVEGDLDQLANADRAERDALTAEIADLKAQLAQSAGDAEREQELNTRLQA